MKIYVDADACPVKDIVAEEGKNSRIPVVMVTSMSHYSEKQKVQEVEIIYVDTGRDAADYRIVQLCKKGDIVVTQDYGLASICLAKGCIVLHHKGFLYTNENIDQLLQSRYVNAKARKAGHRTKGPKAMTEGDRIQFKNLLREILQKEGV